MIMVLGNRFGWYRHEHRLLHAAVLDLGDLLELVLDLGRQTKSHSHTILVPERCRLFKCAVPPP
jgi:hypothetical protein